MSKEIDLNPYFYQTTDDSEAREWCLKHGILDQALKTDPVIEGTMKFNRFALATEGFFHYAIVLCFYGYPNPIDNGLIILALESVPDTRANRVVARANMITLEKTVRDEYGGTEVPTQEQFNSMWSLN